MVILELEMGVEKGVEVMRGGARDWDPTCVSQTLRAGDRLRTKENSRAMLWLYGQRLRVSALSDFSIEAAPSQRTSAYVRLRKGLLYFFHREGPVDVRFQTGTAAAAVRGTEFSLAAEEEGPTVITMLDGEVELSNAWGRITVKSGEQGVAGPDAPPSKTAVINAVNAIQWCLYYPAVLDLDELGLNAELREALAGSLAAYHQGDLLRAVEQYPAARRPQSDEERVYLAGLLLAVGQVEQIEALLAPLSPPGSQTAPRTRPLAAAIQQTIAAVKFQQWQPGGSPQMATEWLAESYYRQSRSDLPGALTAARNAVEQSANFSFAWVRLAELEFSFGNTRAALKALAKGLELSPRNAQALALKGFLLAAQNKTAEARKYFERAIVTDGALANGWLGRGLCKIRSGHAASGAQDLETAAALEPNRSLLRSYLGKARGNLGDDRQAAKELTLARQLDPKDPTVWLYSSLLKQQQNRINEAIADLETSQELNDNRSLFRSRLLLDEDRAVRSANLASIYRDAGMYDVSVREAARAVTYDYTSEAAHLFMSDSFNELRDPTRFNLRYETVWFNELLLANLLSPVGGGRLSQHVSQQEYSRLFEADGFGVANSTTYRSDNKSVTELASQYGTFGGTSYSLDLDYQHNNGVRINNDLDSIEWYSTIKQQITPQDTALVLIKYENYHSGDNFQYYDPTNARPNFRYDEYESPIVVGGWHHEWSPGVHTLLLGGRLENEQHFSDQGANQLLLVENSKGQVYAADSEPFGVAYQNNLEIYMAELNQIFQWDRVTLSAGARFQWGSVDTSVSMTNPAGLARLFRGPAETNVTADFQRATGYGYLTVEPLKQLWLIGGLTYDTITYPSNYRNPPIASGEESASQVGPKAALVWQPLPQATLRGVFTRSLGGVSLDESYRLEPTQLAGFPQTFRSLISESVVGSVSAPEYQTAGVALDLKFPTRTYAGLQFQRLETQVHRDIGLFLLDNGRAPFGTSSTRENLDYGENAFSANVNQLVGNMFVVGAGYGFTHAELQDVLPNVSTKVLSSASQDRQADLQVVNGYVRFNHPSGFFAQADAYWYHQLNFGDDSALAGDSFVQLNLHAGYYFARRRVAVTLGLLNLTDQDYHLNSLTLYSELPRKLTFTASLNFVF